MIEKILDKHISRWGGGVNNRKKLIDELECFMKISKLEGQILETINFENNSAEFPPDYGYTQKENFHVIEHSYFAARIKQLEKRINEIKV